MTKQIAVYLDTDIDGNDLLDSVGNPITAGWYVYEWPLNKLIAGPFEEKPRRKHDKV